MLKELRGFSSSSNGFVPQRAVGKSDAEDAQPSSHVLVFCLATVVGVQRAFAAAGVAVGENAFCIAVEGAGVLEYWNERRLRKALDDIVSSD